MMIMRKRRRRRRKGRWKIVAGGSEGRKRRKL